MDIPLTQIIEILFDLPIDVTAVDGKVRLIKLNGSLSDPEVELMFTLDDEETLLSATGTLEEDSEYRIEIRSGIISLDGSRLRDNEFHYFDTVLIGP